MENDNSARVIKIAGYGEKRMRDAIAQGLVEGDLRRDMQAVLTENERLTTDRRLLQRRNVELEAIRRDSMETKVRAYEAWSRSSRERRKERAFAWQMAVAGFVIGVAAASLIIAIGMLAVRG